MVSKLVILFLSLMLLLMCGYLVYQKVGRGSGGIKSSEESSIVPVHFDVGEVGDPLDRALLTITFDDGHDSQIKNALPLLEKNNFLATFYISTGLLGKKGYMTDEQVLGLASAGHQIAAHTVSHPHLPALSADEAQGELVDSKAYLKARFGVDASDFASPYGDVNEAVMGQVKALYRSHRNVLPGFNYRDSFDAYGVKVQNVLLTTTEADVKAWIDAALVNKSWLVLVYHQVDDGGDAYGTTLQKFEKQIDVIAKSKIDVVTFDKAFAEISPQNVK